MLQKLLAEYGDDHEISCKSIVLTTSIKLSQMCHKTTTTEQRPPKFRSLIAFRTATTTPNRKYSHKLTITTD